MRLTPRYRSYLETIPKCRRWRGTGNLWAGLKWQEWSSALWRTRTAARPKIGSMHEGSARAGTTAIGPPPSPIKMTLGLAAHAGLGARRALSQCLLTRPAVQRSSDSSRRRLFSSPLARSQSAMAPRGRVVESCGVKQRQFRRGRGGKPTREGRQPRAEPQ